MKREVWSVTCDGKAPGAPEAPCGSWIAYAATPDEADDFARKHHWTINDDGVALCPRCSGWSS